MLGPQIQQFMKMTKLLLKNTDVLNQAMKSTIRKLQFSILTAEMTHHEFRPLFSNTKDKMQHNSLASYFEGKKQRKHENVYQCFYRVTGI